MFESARGPRRDRRALPAQERVRLAATGGHPRRLPRPQAFFLATPPPSLCARQHRQRMRARIFVDQRRPRGTLARGLVLLVREDGGGLSAERRRDAQETIDRMVERLGYCRDCAADAASILVRRRFHDLVI